jgi:hypothetical protein
LNGVLSDITAAEIEAIWVEGVVMITTEAAQDTPPPVARSSPESTISYTELMEPAPLLPPPTPSVDCGGVPVIWLIIGGVVLLGIVILFAVARMRAY